MITSFVIPFDTVYAQQDNVGKYAIYKVDHIFKTLDILDLDFSGFIKFEIDSFNSNTYDVTTTTYLGESSIENTETVSTSKLFSIDDFVEIIDDDFLGVTNIQTSKAPNSSVTIDGNRYNAEVTKYTITNTYAMESQTDSVGNTIHPNLVVTISGDKKILSDYDIPYSLDLNISNVKVTGIPSQSLNEFEEFTNEVKKSKFSVNVELIETNFLQTTPSSNNNAVSDIGNQIGDITDQIGGIGDQVEELSDIAKNIPVDDIEDKANEVISQIPSSGGGCLIATATYGSELAPQVQQLRELRDNSLLQTESGTSFMNTFNDVYYSFSPIIADYERENPAFKELVKITITPMISSLSILNNVDMDSESSVLGYGISLILLNVGMYLGLPVLVIVRISSFKRSKNYS